MQRIIKKHVKIGTTIHTDGWRGYIGLNQLGFDHYIVNHSSKTNAFVALDGTHTQTIESSWRPAKDFFRQFRVAKDQFPFKLYEYLWRRNIKQSHLDPFDELINVIRRNFDVN